MPTKVVFWRETRGRNGRVRCTPVASVEAPDHLSETEVRERAEATLCANHRLGTWQDLAHGYDIMR